VLFAAIAFTESPGSHQNTVPLRGSAVRFCIEKCELKTKSNNNKVNNINPKRLGRRIPFIHNPAQTLPILTKSTANYIREKSHSLTGILMPLHDSVSTFTGGFFFLGLLSSYLRHLAKAMLGSLLPFQTPQPLQSASSAPDTFTAGDFSPPTARSHPPPLPLSVSCRSSNSHPQRFNGPPRPF